MKAGKMWLGLLALCAAVSVAGTPATAQQQQKPNILFIMGDDRLISSLLAARDGAAAFAPQRRAISAQERFRGLVLWLETSSNHAV